MPAKRFVVATDPLTAEQEQSLRTKLGQIGFWHWLPNFWLLKTFDTTLTAGSLRDKVREAAPQARSFVTEVKPVSPWAASVKGDAAGNRMEEWLETEWQKPD